MHGRVCVVSGHGEKRGRVGRKGQRVHAAHTHTLRPHRHPCCHTTTHTHAHTRACMHARTCHSLALVMWHDDGEVPAPPPALAPNPKIAACHTGACAAPVIGVGVVRHGAHAEELRRERKGGIGGRERKYVW